MNKIIFLFIFSLFFTNEFFASQEPNNNTLKSKLEAKIQHSEEKENYLTRLNKHRKTRKKPRK